MKRKLIFSLFLIGLCSILIGCKKEEIINNENDITSGGWSSNISNLSQDVDSGILNLFISARKKYTKTDFEVISLLGTQVVSGTNYMFLCKDSSSFYVVIVYNDLNNNSEITNSTKIDISTLKELTTSDNEILSGGWNVNTNVTNKLTSPMKEIYDDATLSLETKYIPVSIIGTQVVSGTNYAFLVLNTQTNLYNVITIYHDLEDNSSINNIYEFELSNYN